VDIRHLCGTDRHLKHHVPHNASRTGYAAVRRTALRRVCLHTSGNTREDGLFTSATVLFDPFGADQGKTLQDHILHPRLHVGAIVSTSGETDQVFAGFTWRADVTNRFFIDFGFGGALNNATLHDSNEGPSVGCHALFHESLAAGYKVSEAWRVLATIDHSSNANLCHDNDGLSYAGLAISRKF
jgi:hypothetical protein